MVRSLSAPEPTIPAVPRRGLGPPSPTDGVLSERPFPAAPPAIAVRLAMALRRGLQALADGIVPAQFAVLERSAGILGTASLGAIARFGIADLLDSGPLSAEELAQRTGTDAGALHRVLRALATTGIFVLDSEGRFSNNRLSRALKSGTRHRSREWCQYMAAQSTMTAWSDLERSLLDGKSCFDRVFGMSTWDWFERFPDEREMFAHVMMGITANDAPAIAAIYPFEELRTICDVGGGRGTLLSELLIRYPHLFGVLSDAPGVLESARELLAQRGVADRVELIAGNFFSAVPSGADAYLLKNILHDWDDERCRTILRTVRRAMQPGRRVLLIEAQVPPNETTGIGPLADVQMLVVCSDGKERSVEEQKALLRQCGFDPARVFEYPTIGVVEGRAV
jgi:hypothetical protein